MVLVAVRVYSDHLLFTLVFAVATEDRVIAK